MSMFRLSASVLGLAFLLSGCLAAYDLTPTAQSMGVSTANYRDFNCQELANLAESYGKNQYRPGNDVLTINYYGWMLEAANQVSAEKACYGDAAAQAAAPKVLLYGFCSYSPLGLIDPSDYDTYITPDFLYGDTVDLTQVALEFNAHMRSAYGMSEPYGSCVLEDSQAKLDDRRERISAYEDNLVGNDDVVVAWQPSAQSSQSAAPATPTSVAAVSSNRLAADGLGLTLESPSLELAKGLGLKDNSGAWVVSVTPGSPAAKAGIKPMDVIQDLSGQLVNKPSDVMAIAEKLRSGYKAPLSVWRNRSNHELTLAIPAGVSAPLVISDAVAAALTVSANRAPAASQTQQSANPVGAMYCHAVLATQHTYGATVSPIKLIPGAASDMKPSLKSYIAKVKQEQPGVWGEFKLNTTICAPGAVVCMAETKGPTGKTQNAFQFCHATQAEADAQLKEMRQGDPQAVVFDWP